MKRRLDTAMLGDSGFARVEGDQYWTESWVTQALLDAVKFYGAIWEPACGRGDMTAILERAGYLVVSSDLEGDRLGCVGAMKADFLSDKPLPFGGIGLQEFSIVTNPPYTLAQEFVQTALKRTESVGGKVAMLMRNEYDCAAGRRHLFEHPAFACKLVLTKRPRWVDALMQHSASPRHNFAWYLWDHRHSGPASMKWVPNGGRQ